MKLLRFYLNILIVLTLFFSQQAMSYDAVFNVTGRVSANTCSLQSSRSQNIFLGDHVIGENNFGNKLNSETKKVYWQLEFDCDKNTQINMTLVGSSYSGNESVLVLDRGADSAKGVGVYTYIGNNGVTYARQVLNRKYKVSGSDVNGKTKIYFSSSYVQLENNIEPGKANASMEIEIDYQ